MRKHLSTIIDVAIAVMALACAAAYFHVVINRMPEVQRAAWEQGRVSAVTACGKAVLL